MRATLAAVLLPLAACSRQDGVADDPTPASAATGNVPPAASAARIEPGIAAASSPSETATAPTGSGRFAPGPSGHPSAPPHIREEAATASSGGLPIEVVKRIIRQNYGRFRLCYESGLRLDPTLAGTVRLRFVIESDGSVGSVSDAGSSLSDKGVVGCVERGFGMLSFPQPNGGALVVTYSLSLAPSAP
jgi:hypothetical protein